MRKIILLILLLFSSFIIVYADSPYEVSLYNGIIRVKDGLKVNYLDDDGEIFEEIIPYKAKVYLIAEVNYDKNYDYDYIISLVYKNKTYYLLENINTIYDISDRVDINYNGDNVEITKSFNYENYNLKSKTYSEYYIQKLDNNLDFLYFIDELEICEGPGEYYKCKFIKSNNRNNKLYTNLIISKGFDDNIDEYYWAYITYDNVSGWINLATTKEIYFPFDATFAIIKDYNVNGKKILSGTVVNTLYKQTSREKDYKSIKYYIKELEDYEFTKYLAYPYLKDIKIDNDINIYYDPISNKNTGKINKGTNINTLFKYIDYNNVTWYYLKINDLKGWITFDKLNIEENNNKVNEDKNHSYYYIVIIGGVGIIILSFINGKKKENN